MQKHLFLTGPAGSGKSALLRETLGSLLAIAGGYITETIVDDDGSPLTEMLYPAAAAADHSLYEGIDFMEYDGDTCTRDNDVFRFDAAKLLEEAEYYPYAMLDQLGGFELIIPQFRAALDGLLSLELPIIGALRDEAGILELQSRLGLGDRYPAAARALYEQLRQDEDTLLLETDAVSSEQIRVRILQWISEYLPHI